MCKDVSPFLQKREMRSVKAIFFDLDNTLFDHSRAQAEALSCTLSDYPDIGLSAVPFDVILSAFRRHNDDAWDRYARDEITFHECRVVRFWKTLEELGYPTDAAEMMGDRFLIHYATQTCLIDGAMQTVHTLSQQYPLGIITNGYPGTSQRHKVERMGFAPYFHYIITLEEADGAMKPDPRIFVAAARMARLPSEEIAYVGDDYDLDVVGAARAGMQTVWFRPLGTSAAYDRQSVATYHIDHLTELLEIFSPIPRRRQ
jgi:putative hydrolase of the HAD superfamily